MNEELQVSPEEERLAEHPPVPEAPELPNADRPPVPFTATADAELPPAAPAFSWLRFANVAIFFLALVAANQSWAQIGGQVHLDLLPWYLKALCLITFAWTAMRFAGASARGERVWDRHSRRWFFGMLFVVITMGAITFWYHLHEATEDSDTDESSATSVQLPHRPGDPAA